MANGGGGGGAAIGLICAIPQELNHLRAVLQGAQTEEIGGFRFDRGALEDRAVVLAEAGIGKVNTATVATLIADRFGAGLIAFSGVAGGLDPALDIGDVVIASRAIQHDCGVIEGGTLQPYQAGHVPFFNPTPRLGYDADPALLARIRPALEGLELPPLSRRAGGPGHRPRVVFGTILSGDQYIHCEATRERLHREFGGQAVEMEGAAVAQVAERFGVPWVVIRALSDLAGSESHMDFPAFLHEAAGMAAKLARRLVPVV